MIPAHGEQPLPAPLFLRMVAFAMDCIFVIFASLAAAQAFFPVEIETGMETWKTYVERLQNLEEERNSPPPPHT